MGWGKGDAIIQGFREAEAEGADKKRWREDSACYWRIE